MSGLSRARHHVADIFIRLDSLLEESVAPADALGILVAQGVLPAGGGPSAEQPLAAVASRALAGSGLASGSADAIDKFMRNCEARGRGRDALRFLAHVDTVRREPRRGLTAIPVILFEFLLLLLVFTIQVIFVLPQIETIFEASATPLPALTRLLLALQPLVYVIAPVAIIALLCSLLPILRLPVRIFLDRLKVRVGGAGRALRKSNADRMSGWLGLAGSEPASQRVAIEAARAWHADDVLAGVCADVLRRAGATDDLFLRLSQSRGFDHEFASTVSITGVEMRASALRARWRNAESLPDQPPGLAPVVAHIILGVLIAIVVVAMYLPIFKLGATL